MTSQPPYARYRTGGSDQLIRSLAIERAGLALGEDALFARAAARLSRDNLADTDDPSPSFVGVEGGPFGAVVVGPARVGGAPEILGLGANHVGPDADPSAHGEVVAIRDAAWRLGRGDLTGTTLYTSCECCPMCQAAALGAGIDRVVYVATRAEAAAAGFSDAAQYDLVEGGAPLATALAALADTGRADSLRRALGDSGAVVVDGEGTVLGRAAADGVTTADPTATLPSLAALRAACALAGGPHAPAGATLLCRNAPHLVGAIAADWARIGRPPGRPLGPQDPSKILFLDPTPEEMRPIPSQGPARVLRRADAIVEDVRRAPPQRVLAPTERSEDPPARALAAEAFALWTRLATASPVLRY